MFYIQRDLIVLYYILIAILFLAILAKASGKKVSRGLYVFAILLLILFSALRNAFLYPDISNYYDFFNGQYLLSDENIGDGYRLLNTVCHWFSSSFQFLLIVISILVVGVYGKVIKKYSPYIWLSLFLYILINYYPSFFILRQNCAMAVALLSLKFIIQREPVRFGVCTLIAFSFHATALLVVPLYFLYSLKATKLNMFLLAVGSVFFVAMFMSIANYVNLFSAYYAHYFETEVEEGMWQRTLLKIYIAGVYLFTLRKKFYDEGINRLVFYGMVFNVVICIAAMNIYSAHRLREYFSYADFIGVAIILKEASRIKTIKKTIVFFLVMVYVVALAISFNNYIQGGNMNNQYEFFWNSTIR